AGVNPYTHGIAATAKDGNVAYAFKAQQPFTHHGLGVVAEIIDIEAGAFFGCQRTDEQEARRLLVHRDANLTDLFRQARFGQPHAVLDHNLSSVQIRARLEGDGNLRNALGGGALNVEHALYTVDLLLQRSSD